MHHFQDDRLYRTTDPELAIIGTKGTLAQWRHRGVGPRYVRFGNRVLYEGRALNEFLAAHVVDPVAA